MEEHSIPMTKPAKLAYLLMSLALVVFALTGFFLDHSFPPWATFALKILHHGSEGAWLEEYVTSLQCAMCMKKQKGNFLH